MLNTPKTPVLDYFKTGPSRSQRSKAKSMNTPHLFIHEDAEVLRTCWFFAPEFDYIGDNSLLKVAADVVDTTDV